MFLNTVFECARVQTNTTNKQTGLNKHKMFCHEQTFVFTKVRALQFLERKNERLLWSASKRIEFCSEKVLQKLFSFFFQATLLLNSMFLKTSSTFTQIGWVPKSLKKIFNIFVCDGSTTFKEPFLFFVAFP